MSARRALLAGSMAMVSLSCAGSISTAQDRPSVTPIFVQSTSLEVTPMSDAAPSSTDARVMNGAALIAVQNRTDRALIVTAIRVEAQDRGPFSFPATRTGFDRPVAPGETAELRCPLSVHWNSTSDTASPNRVALKVTVTLGEGGPYVFNLYAPVYSVRFR